MRLLLVLVFLLNSTYVFPQSNGVIQFLNEVDSIDREDLLLKQNQTTDQILEITGTDILMTFNNRLELYNESDEPNQQLTNKMIVHEYVNSKLTVEKDNCPLMIIQTEDFSPTIIKYLEKDQLVTENYLTGEFQSTPLFRNVNFDESTFSSHEVKQMFEMMHLVSNALEPLCE